MHTENFPDGEAGVAKATDLIRAANSGALRREMFDAVGDAKTKLAKWSDDDQSAEDGALVKLKVVQAIGFAASLVLSALVAWMLSRAIARPLGAMTQAMLRLAGGDHSILVPAVGRT